ncbi:MAG TPA: Spy/CpxP family protein refolding chaperone [Candidatus Binatia bacterium]|jgi:protein CpxP|nr:Spy/CpxP family protein refolding chaperone [Candidatus Binatia bacterium]
MKLQKISAGACALTITALLAGSAALAQPGFGRPAMRQQMRTRLFDELKLSDTQRSDVQNIFASGRQAIAPLAQQLREKQAALRDSVNGGAFDETAVRAQAQQIADLQAQVIVARAQIRNQFLGVLTDDQKARLSELRAERMQRFQEWRQQHSAGGTQS